MNVSKPLQLQAYEYIKEKIISREFKYDTIYSETKIAKELGISRTPVRDGIQFLTQEKYIDIIPNKGFILHKMTIKDFEDTTQIRSAVEGYCVQEITKNLISENSKNNTKALKTLNKLKELINEQKIIASTTKNIEEFMELDFQIHIEIVHYVENNELAKTFETYLYRMRNFVAHSLTHPGRLEQTIREHEEIISYIENKNIYQAYESTLLHLESPKSISL